MTTKVKICGLRTSEALDAALDAGADFVGLVFYPKSPRHLDVATGKALRKHAENRSGARVVTLLVDPDDTLVAEIAREVHPDLIQLHGHETPARVAEIRQRFGLPIIKAVSVGTSAEVAAATTYHDPGARADIVLFDAGPPAGPGALPGGNGLAFDWTILSDLKIALPFALAGGLTPENVAEAIRLTRAPIVDVSSGVESAPGEKDPKLIRRFLHAAKAAKQVPSPRER